MGRLIVSIQRSAISASAISYELLTHYRTEEGISLEGAKYVCCRIPHRKKKAIG
ncbi:MAG: hypothetical protein F6K24_26680 [Okeania sp. SIO2D1]|nr:hypothetical protein [Okeania sp. SIO2D1]